MIQRVVLVKLKKSHASDAERDQVAQHTREVLASIPLVKSLTVGVAADGRSRREWDLTILVRFDDLEAVESYRTERTHRAYVDVF